MLLDPWLDPKGGWGNGPSVRSNGGTGGRKRNGGSPQPWTPFSAGCPAIHPRCRWSAARYRGRPTPLRLPLGSLYVHHTYQPALPCTTFARCAANMRSMQRFHQDTRGWDDIGYR